MGFSDFSSIRSEVSPDNYKDSVDYAFYNKKDNSKPVMLLEAKKLGTNLKDPRIIKQLCNYLGVMGTQWGLITDGNKYVMYNSNSGTSFEDKKFKTWEIKTFDTDDGVSLQNLAEQFLGLIERKCLENDEIQNTYEQYAVKSQIEDAIDSLLTKPFDTLINAIRREFKEERVIVRNGLKIKSSQIKDHLEQLTDDDGRVQFDGLRDLEIDKSNDIISKVASFQESKDNNAKKLTFSNVRKRITVQDLLNKNLLKEGQPLRFEFKGEVTWGRVTGNGQIEVNGEAFDSLSGAGAKARGDGKGCSGWYYWAYKDSDTGNWEKLLSLRNKFKKLIMDEAA